MMLRILLPLALACAATACSGRPSLHEDSGRAFERVWQVQTDSTPKDKLAPFSAAEAAIVMGNHAVRYDKGGRAKPSGGGGGLGAGGILTPATTDLGALGLGGGSDGGGGPGDRNIRLEAK